MDTLVDVFNDDAFNAISLSAAISNMDHVPGMAGEYAFKGAATGVATLDVAIEMKDETIALIKEQPRGAPPEIEIKDKPRLLKFSAPHFPLDTSISADEIAKVRAFGGNELASVESVVLTQLVKMNRRLDYTMEFLRLGAVMGRVVGGSGDVLVDLFEEFGITNSLGQHAPETFDFDLMNPFADIQTLCMGLHRFIARNAKTEIPNSANVMGFAGDRFFDKFIRHPRVRETYAGTQAAAERLGGGLSFRAFEFGGIIFLNYRGSDDNQTIAIDDEEVRFFLSGVPDLWAEYYAPADFIETVNTEGLPRYAKIAPVRPHDKRVQIHTQMNPLPLCLRPKTLVRGVSSDDFI